MVVKAQVHAGGRGKGGGIRVADSAEKACLKAGQIIGMQLVTHQTGAEGQQVKRVLVEKASNIAKEFYLGITLDRAQSKVVVMASTEGGIEIEQVAARMPARILYETVDPATGLLPFQASRLAFGLGFSDSAVRQTARLILGLWEMYDAEDCSLAEINPLAQTGEGEIIALDAKISFDDNGLFDTET